MSYMDFFSLQVLKSDPDDGFAKVHLGFILKREGLYEDAIVHLRGGIESNQEGTSEGKYFFHLGDAYHRTGHPEEVSFMFFCKFVWGSSPGRVILKTLKMGPTAIVLLSIGNGVGKQS